MRNKNKKKRYVSIEGQKGIRKDTITSKYFVRKCIKGKQYTASFGKLTEAIHWRNCFHPSLTFTKVDKSISTPDVYKRKSDVTTSRPNGVENHFYFSDVWDLYKSQHLPSLEIQIYEDRIFHAQKFYGALMDYKMIELNPVVIDSFIQKKVEEAKIINNPRRFNFDNDIKSFKALLNWYRENYDGMFVNPILKRHKTMGIIKRKAKNKKKMTREQVLAFFNALDDQFWKDFAEIQFYATARVSEIAGLQVESVNLEESAMEIKHVSVWGNGKQFYFLKDIPKNGEERFVHLNSRMREILERRLALTSKTKCPHENGSSGKPLSFAFNIDGKPLDYRKIQYQYNKALKKANLYPEFRSTHIMRKAMANIVRKKVGLEAAQAAGGWKSRDVVESFYTDAPNELNIEAVNVIEQYMSEGKAVNAEPVSSVPVPRRLTLVD